MTPEGNIFHAANGYLSPEDLLEEIEFARNLFVRIQESDGNSQSLVRDAHRKRLEELGYSEDEIAGAMSGDPFKSMTLIQDIEGGNIFAGKTRKEILMANAFSIKHPMMDYQTFEEDPTVLVGKGSSAFVSQQGGNAGSPRKDHSSPDLNSENE